jgi:acetyl esterase/lipase
MTQRTVLVILWLFFAGTVSLSARVEKNVVYGMYSGLALLMDIHYPEKPNGYGVIFIMGSGWHMPLASNAGALKDRAASNNFLQKLTQAGYTVFAINHRAAPRFRYPAAVEDAQRAVRFVRHHAKEYSIDPGRIGGMGGSSSGGHLVSMLGTLDGKGNPEDPDPVNRQSSRLQCVVAAAAPSDLAKIKTEAGLMAVTSFVGSPLRDTNPATAEYKTYREASPVTHVSADDAPFLLVHGDADRTVPFEQAELMEAALRKAGVEVQLVRIPGGGHSENFEGATNPPDFLGEMVRWMDRHLPVSKGVSEK